MGIELVGQVGLQLPGLAIGVKAVESLGAFGDSLMSEVMGRYYNLARNGLMFAAVNSAAQALSLTGTTTYTGMIVYNKPGSGKNLALLEAIWVPTIAETGVGAVQLFSQAPAATLPTLTGTNVAGSPFNTLINGTVSSVAASVASSCTLAANPIFLRPLIGIPWVTATAQAAIMGKDEIAGGIIVPPGAGVGFVAVTTAITGIAYLSWAELPI